MTILLLLWNKIKLYVLAAGAVLAILGGVYAKGRHDADQAEEAAVAKQRAKDLEAKQEIHDETSKMSDADLDAKLDHWVRPEQK